MNNINIGLLFGMSHRTFNLCGHGLIGGYLVWFVVICGVYTDLLSLVAVSLKSREKQKKL